MEKTYACRLYSGTSGIVLPVPKYQFPAPFESASRLTYFATLFNSLEVNSSFYKVPQLATVYKWGVSVPDDFTFTFKLWQGITHQKGLEFKKEDVGRFMTIINQVGVKKGCLLIQLPPSIGNKYIGQLKKLLECIRQMNIDNWRVAVEFRNKSWYDSSTYKLLNTFNLALVIHDMPLSATPLVDQTVDFMYLRFHGPTGNYTGSYSDDFLREYAAYVSDWIAEGKEVYLYFNNTIGDALKNLESINAFIHTKQKDHA